MLDRIKAMADRNNDGKLDKNDLESLRGDNNGLMIDKLKAKADANNDGKLSMDDIKSALR